MIKIYLYDKDPKHQFLINKRESAGLKHLNDSKVFIETKKIQTKNVKHWLFLIILLLICLVIKSLNLIVNELFIRGRKVNISFVFISQSYFAIPKILTILYTLFHYENSKQTRASTNHI